MSRPNKGPHLELNEHGVYEIRWTENGRSKRRSTGETDRGEAQRTFAGFLLESERQASPDRLTVREAVDAYKAEHVAEKVAAKATADFSLRPILAHFGDMEIRDIQPADVRDYMRKRRQGKLGGARARPVVDSTIRRELVALIAALNFAASERLIPAVPPIALPEPGEARDRWLTRGEGERLIAAAAQGWTLASEAPMPRVYLFTMLAIETAGRKEALETLTWFQVRDGLIYLNPEGRKQTKKRRAIVPISDRLAPVLARARRDARSEWVLGKPGSIRKAFEGAVERAGLADVTPHVLRHTWATWAARDGVDLWKIAGILGDTLATVEKTYLHHCPHHLRDAVNRVRREREEEA
jgi:integrase